MSEPHTIDIRLGGRIRTLRLERGLTLETLADKAEVSRAMLSRIERGESSPTAQMLNKVCGGLGVTLSALFAEPMVRVSPLAQRESQPVWRDPATNYLRRTVSPSGTGSPVDIAEVEFPAQAVVGFDNRRPVNADQHIWVLSGVLELTLGEEIYRLCDGDCLMMRLDRPIVFRNPTDKITRYAVVICQGAGAV
jgi:transcriptional regulator with XRE-family HTH domain